MNLLNWLKRKLWIRRYSWNMLMMEEVKLKLEEKFIKEAEEQKQKMIWAIEREENWLAEQTDSHKYEDRQRKIRAEKKLRMLKESLAGQEKQLADGGKVMGAIRNNISIIEENGRYLKGKF